jgi:predicted esterase
LAGSFIRKFGGLDPVRHYVIAPEGLNRFYFEGVNEQPVSSWMTRLDRLDEIADYVLFLERLRSSLQWELYTEAKVILLGFSQGVSSLLRWMHNAHPRADHLVLWAGGLPEDADFAASRDYFSGIPATFFLGNADPYITVERVQERMRTPLPGDIRPVLRVFAGDHRVSREVLVDWLEEQGML